MNEVQLSVVLSLCSRVEFQIKVSIIQQLHTCPLAGGHVPRGTASQYQGSELSGLGQLPPKQNQKADNQEGKQRMLRRKQPMLMLMQHH